MTLPSAMRMAARSLPLLLSLYVVVLGASIGRPIWIDEFTHFAFAAEPSSRAAWDMFVATADYNQHGQTGIYIMLNYWTLSHIGIDATLLRLPSIVCGLFLLATATMMFRLLGFALFWQFMVLAALAGQHLLLHFIGEARAYTPIPAAAMGLLLYYLARPRYPRSRAVLALGVFSAVLGAAMHPYFAIYWPAVCLVAHVHHRAGSGEPFRLRALLASANPGLVAFGAAIYLGLGSVTWLREQPRFGLDPFEWLQFHGAWSNFTDYSHTQFLDGSYGLAAGLTAAAVLGLLLAPGAVRGRARALAAPALLVTLSVALSLLISWSSYLAEYWILPRQWIGSVVLVAVGVVWLWAEAARIWWRASPLLGLSICGLCAIIVSGQAMTIQRVKLGEIRAYLAAPPALRDAAACVPPNHLNVSTLPNEERNNTLVELANRNIACGGPVWPVFREYYSGPPPGLADRQAAIQQ